MDWNSAMEDERRMLKGIVAMLFSFAVLAENLRGRSRPVRGFILWVLRIAEDIAREFVLATADDHGASAHLPSALVMPAMQGGDGPADAIRLAQSFRALAILLDRVASRGFGRRKRRAAQASFAARGRMMLALQCLVAIARLLAEVDASSFPLAATRCAVERIDSS